MKEVFLEGSVTSKEFSLGTTGPQRIGHGTDTGQEAVD